MTLLNLVAKRSVIEVEVGLVSRNASGCGLVIILFVVILAEALKEWVDLPEVEVSVSPVLGHRSCMVEPYGALSTISSADDIFALLKLFCCLVNVSG